MVSGARSSRETSRGELPLRSLGRYEILARIASGGMGSVYWARARGAVGFTKDVAIKLTHQHLREQEDLAKTLLDEARLASRIKHPNVVDVLDLGDDALGLYLVMEYVEGDSLAGILKACREAERTIPLPVGARILVDALAGLHAVHELVDEHGIALHAVHRDFSPHNVLVSVDGTTKLTDFGVAKTRDKLLQTASGLVKGKLPYMSPEQARAKELDRRSDVWSAGAVLWELCAHRRLFDSNNDVELLMQIVTQPPPLLSEAGFDVPLALEEAVAAALTPELEDRIGTAAALARRIEDAVGLADRAEVAAFVRPLVAPKLAARREAAQAIAAERSTEEDDEGPSPSPTVREGKRSIDPEPETELATADKSAAERTGVTASDVVVLPKHKRSWIAAPVAVLAAIAVVALTVRSMSQGSTSATGPGSAAAGEPRSSSAAPPRPSGQQITAEPIATAAVAATAHSLPTRVIESASAPAAAPSDEPAPPKRAPRRGPPPKASGEGLFDSPYERH